MAKPRIIHLSGEVSQELYNYVSESIIDLELEKHAPIQIWFNSVGGDTRQAFAMYDLLSTSNCDIIGIVVGVCYSAAPFILQACKTRLATPNAQFMMHVGSMSLSDVHASEVQAVIDSERAEQKEMDELMLARVTNKRKAQRHIRTGAYLSAQEAKDLGLIDDIIKRR
jgi:ATP-dependent Clp protease protease subunit